MATDSPSTKINLKIDLRAIIVVLLLVIAGMLAWWQPWNDRRSDTETIEVTGTSTVKAVPDEYVFYPSYRFAASTRDRALEVMTNKSNVVIANLKKLGVADEKIKTSLDGNEFYPIYSGGGSSNTAYSLQITVTVNDKDLAQKVQDYLLTTKPRGSVTPVPTFSDAKQDELEIQARDEATKDARSKAEQSAKNLGFSLGGVKAVVDGVGFSGYDLPGRAQLEDSVSSSPSKFVLQPGENELSYTVTVTYFIK